jgi:hypothetical protein
MKGNLGAFQEGGTEMARRQGRQYWQEHVEAWARSGQTLSAYCAAQGLSAYTFRRWRHRLGRGAQPAQSLTLVPVKVQGCATRAAVQLHSPSGWKIELAGTEAAWLAELLRRLP